MRLLKPEDHKRSSAVANCLMNRERRLTGSNSYCRDLHIDILSLLREKMRSGVVRWTDLC